MPNATCQHRELAFLSRNEGVVCVGCGATWLRQRTHPERGLPLSRLLLLLDDPAPVPPPPPEAPHL